MQAQSVRVNYRPTRIGFCIRSESIDDLRRALLLTHTLCGGRFNPLIPVGEDIAPHLVRAFRADILYPVADDNRLHNFISGFPHLRWPDFDQHLFQQENGGAHPAFLDIYHQVGHIFEDHVKGQQAPRLRAKLFTWDNTDPLRDVMLAYFGSYADKSEVGRNYNALVVENLRGETVKLSANENIPPDAFTALSPSAITRYDLHWDRPRMTKAQHGIYVGRASNFTDLLTFWNMRAADIELVFYDPSHADRLGPLKDAFISHLEERPTGPLESDDRVGIWSKSPDAITEEQNWGTRPIFCSVNANTWRNPRFRPPQMQYDPQWAFSSVSTDRMPPELTFQLPKKLFYETHWLPAQKFVASVKLPSLYNRANEKWTFRTPFLPELNEFLGRAVLFNARRARSEIDGLAIIADTNTQDLTIRALEKKAVVAKVLEAFGMKAMPSSAGRITERLLQQMGGPQGCRVFKITGVRKLIESYGPLQSFKRSAAIQMIRDIDPVTSQPRFSDFESLYIEPREKPRLTPDDVFSFLLKKGVFRTGLDLRCPNCELDFWIHLDDISTEVPCELCNARFNITTQLKDRDWTYRRSGIFGKDDRQQGAIPVALTLQQIDTTIHLDPAITVTSMEIESASDSFKSCESDLILLTNSYDDRIALLIGECKGGKPENAITEDDVLKMTALADAFPQDRIQAFIIFSKTSSFSAEEIELCKKAQSDREFRVILLSQRELEPYFVYERTAKEFTIRQPTAVSLEDLARNTHEVFFEPKPKAR